jgi:hypothetical protein
MPPLSPAKLTDKQQSVATDAASQSSSARAPSVLIPDSRVPVNDGTNRITFRWKANIDFDKVSRQSAKMNEEIHAFLNEIFSDEDSHLYQWGTDGVDKFRPISGMSPVEVRSYICPSISVIPAQSLIILPIRFGFSNSTPTAWRNKPATKEILERKGTTPAVQAENRQSQATFY